jgi:hypothetical protein
MKKYVLISLVLVGFVSAMSFLVNGDFEDELTTGWYQYIGPNGTIVRGVGYDGDSDYEAYVYKGTGNGNTKLYQIVEVPTTDLEFSVNAKLIASSTSGSCWAGASILICYYGDDDTHLGCSRIAHRTAACPWSNTDTSHVTQVTDTLWHNYAFNIDDEISVIPSVTGTDVRKILVALHGECRSG